MTGCPGWWCCVFGGGSVWGGGGLECVVSYQNDGEGVWRVVCIISHHHIIPCIIYLSYAPRRVKGLDGVGEVRGLPRGAHAAEEVDDPLLWCCGIERTRRLV